MIKTVLFDLDGTLIDTPPIILDTFKELFEMYLKDVIISDDELSSFLGQPLYVTFEKYVKDPKVVLEMVDVYRDISELKIKDGLHAYPKAVETMRYLKKKNVRIGVVTSKLKTVAQSHLKLVGLDDFVEGIIGYEDVEKHKPDPEPIIKGMALFGSKKEETVYVGDHENDIISAKKAGVLTCAVSYSLRLKAMLFEQPDFIIDELIHIKDMI